MPGRIIPLPSGALRRPIPAQAGVGLRFPHHDHVLTHDARAAWLEVHPENYLGDGVAAEILLAVRERLSRVAACHRPVAGLGRRR